MSSEKHTERAPSDAEIEKWRAEALAATALARKNNADAVVAEHVAEITGINRDREVELRTRELATDQYHHVYRFLSSVGQATSLTCMAQLNEWDRLDPECNIEIVFNSPGGDVIHGLALYDFIQEIRRRGHHVTTSAIGYAASMGGILLQAGDVRAMSREAWVLIHEVSFGSSGSYGEVEDMVNWIGRIQDRVLDIFATRSAGSGAPEPLTRGQLARRWKRTDWWLSSDECLRHGIVDVVR